MKIFFILFCIGIFICFEKFGFKENINKKGVFLFIGFAIISSCFISNNRFYSMMAMYTYLMCLFVQDKRTYYISKVWILPTVLITFLLKEVYSVVSSCLFGVPCLILHLVRKESIGSADVCFMFYFGFLLGVERMFVCVFVALILGFLFLLISKKKIVPFVSCLSVGAWIALLRGYSIWFYIYGILLS